MGGVVSVRGGCGRCGGFLLLDMEYDVESNHWESVRVCANCGHIAGRGRPPTAEEMVPEIAEVATRRGGRPGYIAPSMALARARGIEVAG